MWTGMVNPGKDLTEVQLCGAMEEKSTSMIALLTFKVGYRERARERERERERWREGERER